MNLPRTRWIHVRDDGTEEDFLAEPESVPTLRVKVEFQNAQFVEESTETSLNKRALRPAAR
jgi:hypothetical protein